MMTRDDIELLTSWDAVKQRRVRIELTYLGFLVTGPEYQEEIISYRQIDQARFPLSMFEKAIEHVQRPVLRHVVPQPSPRKPRARQTKTEQKPNE